MPLVTPTLILAVVAILVILLFTLVLYGISKLCELKEVNFKKSFVIAICSSIISALLNILFGIIFPQTLFSFLFVLIFSFLVFHFLLHSFYKNGWAKSILVYVLYGIGIGIVLVLSLLLKGMING